VARRVGAFRWSPFGEVVAYSVMLSTIGFIGVGNMGLAMALRLLELGHAVRACDIDAGRVALAVAHGATAASTPAALATGCGCVIIAVVDAVQTEAVLFGADGVAAALPAGACVMLCPTLGPATVEACAARLAAGGIDCIDAPMSGGPARARDGSMSLMVACAEPVYARHAALIAALSAHVFRIGERPGDGARTKLVNNLLAAVNLAGAAEALALAERIGLDPARTLDVIERSSGQSWIGADRMRRALAGDLAPRAHTTLLRKDSQLALAMAAAAGFDAALGRRAASVFEAACAAGFGALDDASLLEFLRGVDVEAVPQPAVPVRSATQRAAPGA
jgi:3-hydroxyisobutyrate dehydrogenase